MNIEEVAEENPDAIVTQPIDIHKGITKEQALSVASGVVRSPFRNSQPICPMPFFLHTSKGGSLPETCELWSRVPFCIPETCELARFGSGALGATATCGPTSGKLRRGTKRTGWHLHLH